MVVRRLSLGALLLACLATVVMGQTVRRKAPEPNEPVIVVGGGLAGLSAAIEAVQQGNAVILLESEPQLGGNSAKASSGMNAVGTDAQRAFGIDDSIDLFYRDTMTAGDHENDAALVQLLVDDSRDAHSFLLSAGLNLSDLNLCGGHSRMRTHWLPQPPPGARPVPVGLAIIKALSAKLEQLKAENPNQVTILLNSRVLGLTTWNEYVTGVRYRKQDGKTDEVSGKAVVLATGGFSADAKEDASLMKEFASDLLTLPTTNGAFARGDGVKMARAMGAHVIGMQRVQVHPTAFIDPANPKANTLFLAAEALRGKGAILVNDKGKRFGNELGRRDYLTARIQRDCSTSEETGRNRYIAYMLMNEEAVESFGRPAFNFYAVVKKFFTKYESAEDAAKALKIPANQLTETLNEYSQYAKGGSRDGQKDGFDKTVFPVAYSPSAPLYVARITPAVHYTMGGLKIDRLGFVWNGVSGKPFKGLLAAGEAAGGVHGANRLAGNSLLECIVFGRAAGRSAASISHTPATIYTPLNEEPQFGARSDHTEL